jgi:hypothetical protein
VTITSTPHLNNNMKESPMTNLITGDIEYVGNGEFLADDRSLVRRVVDCDLDDSAKTVVLHALSDASDDDDDDAYFALAANGWL